MFKSLITTAALCLASTACFAQVADSPASSLPSGAYTLDPAHTSVTWQVSHLGLSNYTARFAKVEGTLDFDAKDPTKSKLSVSVDPASIRTDFPTPKEKDFDKELVEGADWFNALKFPAITYTSTKIEKTSDKTGKITGNLSFLGVTQPLTLDVTFNGGFAKHPFTGAAAMGFSARGSLKRSQWGMAKYLPMVGDDVTLIIESEFNQPAPAPKAAKQ